MLQETSLFMQKDAN